MHSIVFVRPKNCIKNNNVVSLFAIARGMVSVRLPMYKKMNPIRENGFSMVEVLVAILILSACVLGAAGLQLASARAIQQSSYQTMGWRLAADIADTVRALAADGQNEAVRGLLDMDYTSISGAMPGLASGCYFAQCELGEFARSEVNEWKRRMATSFPTARLRICRDADPWFSNGQSYKWNCSGGSAGNAALVVKLGWQARNPDGTLVKEGDGEFPPLVVLAIGAT